jgi:predicted flap endonuclease-1-like 5' DNA nuclease
LEEAGSAYRMMDPTSWPRQAQLANEGKWAELVEFQKFLDTGRENTGDFANPSKAEQMALGILGFSINPEDLKIVEGIGPKIEELLKAGGINNWTELSTSTVERLKEILTEAGERFRLANPSTWSKQAQLASEGKWQELKDYQDFLTAGNEPV